MLECHMKYRLVTPYAYFNCHACFVSIRFSSKKSTPIPLCKIINVTYVRRYAKLSLPVWAPTSHVSWMLTGLAS